MSRTTHSKIYKAKINAKVTETTKLCVDNLDFSRMVVSLLIP